MDSKFMIQKSLVHKTLLVIIESYFLGIYETKEEEEEEEENEEKEEKDSEIDSEDNNSDDESDEDKDWREAFDILRWELKDFIIE